MTCSVDDCYYPLGLSSEWVTKPSTDFTCVVRNCTIDSTTPAGCDKRMKIEHFVHEFRLDAKYDNSASYDCLNNITCSYTEFDTNDTSTAFNITSQVNVKYTHVNHSFSWILYILAGILMAVFVGYLTMCYCKKRLN